jgi:hypothetical protein
VPRRQARSDRFLHALQMAGRAATTTPVATRLISGDQIVGVQFLAPRENQIVVFSGAPNGRHCTPPFTYEISSAASAVHTVVELPPNLPVVVNVNGKHIRHGRVNSQGVLSFRDAATGTRKVAIRSVRHDQ